MYLTPHVYVQSFRAGEVLPHMDRSIDHHRKLRTWFVPKGIRRKVYIVLCQWVYLVVHVIRLTYSMFARADRHMHINLEKQPANEIDACFV